MVITETTTEGCYCSNSYYRLLLLQLLLSIALLLLPLRITVAHYNCCWLLLVVLLLNCHWGRFYYGLTIQWIASYINYYYHYYTSTHLLLLLYFWFADFRLLWLLNNATADWMCNCCGDNIAIVDCVSLWIQLLLWVVIEQIALLLQQSYLIDTMDYIGFILRILPLRILQCCFVLHCCSGFYCNSGLKMILRIILLLWIVSRFYCYYGMLQMLLYCSRYCIAIVALLL